MTYSKIPLTDEEKTVLRARYDAAAHAIQSTIRLEMSLDEQKKVPLDRQSTGPNHLRVGINTAHADLSAVAGLLIRKGLITEDEYFEAIVEGTEVEAERCRQIFIQKYPHMKNVSFS